MALRPTGDRVLDQITGTIVERFQPRRIVLFGSRARGGSLVYTVEREGRTLYERS